jgi:hypothetical protein
MNSAQDESPIQVLDTHSLQVSLGIVKAVDRTSA